MCYCASHLYLNLPLCEKSHKVIVVCSPEPGQVEVGQTLLPCHGGQKVPKHRTVDRQQEQMGGHDTIAGDHHQRGLQAGPVQVQHGGSGMQSHLKLFIFVIKKHLLQIYGATKYTYVNLVQKVVMIPHIKQCFTSF